MGLRSPALYGNKPHGRSQASGHRHQLGRGVGVGQENGPKWVEPGSLEATLATTPCSCHARLLHHGCRAAPTELGAPSATPRAPCAVPAALPGSTGQEAPATGDLCEDGAPPSCRGRGAVPEGLSAGAERAASLLHDCVFRAGLCEGSGTFQQPVCAGQMDVPWQHRPEHGLGSAPTGPAPARPRLPGASPLSRGGRSASTRCRTPVRSAAALPAAPGALQHEPAHQTPARTPAPRTLIPAVRERPGRGHSRSRAQHPAL